MTRLANELRADEQEVVWPKYSSSAAIISKQAAEALSTTDIAAMGFGRRVKKLCGIAVILQHSAESLVTAYAGYWPVVADFPRREEKDVAPALVVSLRVKMINEIGQRATQRGFAKQHQLR